MSLLFIHPRASLLIFLARRRQYPGMIWSLLCSLISAFKTRGSLGRTVLKLIDEGYRGILINLSDDSMAGVGRSVGDITLRNENDTVEVAKRLGLEEVFFLNYPNPSCPKTQTAPKAHS